MADGPSVGWFPDQRQIGMFPIRSVPMVCLVPDKADSPVTNKGRLGRIRSLVVLAAFSNIAKRASSGSATPGARSGNLRSIVDVGPVTYH